jgi:hypothetical protein
VSRPISPARTGSFTSVHSQRKQQDDSKDIIEKQTTTTKKKQVRLVRQPSPSYHRHPDSGSTTTGIKKETLSYDRYLYIQPQSKNFYSILAFSVESNERRKMVCIHITASHLRMFFLKKKYDPSKKKLKITVSLLKGNAIMSVNFS